LNHTAPVAIPVLPKEFRKASFLGGLHRWMNEKFNAMVGPHSPLPLPHMWNEDQLEVDPMGIDPFRNIGIRLGPVTIDVTRIGLFAAEAAINVKSLDPGRPKRSYLGALSSPSTIDAGP
jgi:hypothetical protein